MKKPSEIIAVDIGNTSVLFGHLSGGRLKKTHRMRTADVQARALGILKKHFPLKKIESVVIASVVPSAGNYLRKALPKLGLRTLLIGKDLSVPIQNKYKDPRQVGMDRLMNALAVFQEYRRAAIVVDFGTAITFDVVSKKGEYLGGVIAPGIEISLEALFQKTALLPRIRLTHPKGVLGRDTVESIRSGCTFGIGGLCDKIIEQIGRTCHLSPLVVATGGYAQFMARYCQKIAKIEPNLTLKGIWITYQAALKNALTKK